MEVSGVRSNGITRIDRRLYDAAVLGNFEEFIDVQNIHTLLTPNKNTVLHVHLTSGASQTQTNHNASQTFIQQIKGNCVDLIFHRSKLPVSEQFVKQILDKCEDLVLLPNAKGETLLHIAARYGHSDIAKLLIERAKAFPPDIENGIGAEKKFIRATNRDGDTALHEAVRYHQVEIAEILLKMDPDYSCCVNNANETPLYVATERRYKDMVSKILNTLKSPAYDGPHQRTALHAAVINRDSEMARVLLANEYLKGAVKHADMKGWIPLHYAAETGDSDLTKLLLEQDEYTSYMQDNEGRTVLHIAAYYNHMFIVQMIIEHCPDCSEVVDKKGWNALHYAVNGNSSLVVDTIMNNPSLSNLYNEKDVDGNTPLHHFANSHMFCHKLVFHPRVDKLAVNRNDQTATDVWYDDMVNSESGIGKLMPISILEKVGVIRSRRNLKRKEETGEKYYYKLRFTKEARESHLLVATLIATVTFAAGITLPGGTIQDGEHKGSPILGHRTSFKAFMVSNTAALVMAASAAFIHLFSPLNKAKWKDSYLSEVAFSFTLVAVAAMVVAFATGTFVVLGSSPIGIAVITLGLSFFLVFRQVLKMSFPHTFLYTFGKNLLDVISFSFLKLTPGPFSSFLVIFKLGHPEGRIFI